MLITWKKPFLTGHRYMGHKGNYAIVVSVEATSSFYEGIHCPATILYDDGMLFTVEPITYQLGFYEIIG